MNKLMTLLSLTLLPLSFSAGAYTVTKTIDIQTYNGLESIQIAMNQLQSGNQDIVTYEHLRTYIGNQKYGLFSTPASWCRVLGFQYLAYAEIGMHEDGFNYSKGLAFNSHGTVEFQNAKKLNGKLPINILSCTNNQEFEY